MKLLFSSTIMISAFLLFLSQPLLTKMIMPMLGGSASTWNTSVVFYQCVLLLGYLYAHKVHQRMRVETQWVLHSVVVFSPLLVLPFDIPNWWIPPSIENPIPSLLLLLLVVVGLPFFVLSSTNSLTQRWFSLSGSSLSEKPYFLYSSSNIGSMAALLSYPFIVEPSLTVKSQSQLWFWVYILFCMLISVCSTIAFMRTRNRKEVKKTSQPLLPSPERLSKESLKKIILWSLITNFLMISMTSYLTNHTDVNMIPYYWLLPLIIYLFSFIVAFSGKKVLHTSSEKTPFVLLFLVVFLLWSFNLKIHPLLEYLMHCVALLYICIYCHQKIYHLRPKSSHLTDYYLWISIGGVVGGIMASFIAPLIFNTAIEYYLGVVLFFLVVSIEVHKEFLTNHDKYYGFITFTLLMIIHAMSSLGQYYLMLVLSLSFILLGLYTTYIEKTYRFTAILLAIFLATSISHHLDSNILLEKRNFYGVSRVYYSPSNNTYVYKNGNTLHGAQSLDEETRLVPLSYYSKNGPLGQFFQSIKPFSEKWTIGLVGLGVGNALSYKTSEQKWKVYEIDPLVKQIASNTTFFTFVEAFQPEIIMGDARLSLAKEQEKLDVLILDAYSSDSIPTHLLTKEALEIYRKNLNPDGLILFHISNRFLHLEPIVGNLTKHQGMVTYVNFDNDPTNKNLGETSSKWVVSSSSKKHIQSLTSNEKWTELFYNHDYPLWTDSSSSILKIIR
jgi:hypothetical protein